MPSSLKKILQFLGFLGLGSAILWLVFRSQNAAFQAQCQLDGVPPGECSLIKKLLDDFSTINLWWMFLVMVAFTVSNIFRARRWQMMLAPIGHPVKFSNSLLTIFLGYFANLGFPRIGEVVRAGSLAKYEKIPLEKVMGTMVLDRMIDFLCLLLAIGLAFLLQGGVLLDFISKNSTSGNGQSSGGLMSNPIFQVLLFGGAASVVLFFIFRKKLLQLPVFQKVIILLEGFHAGLRSVFSLEKPGWFWFYSIGIWVMFFLQCVFGLYAFPPTAHLDLQAALMIFVLGTLGFLIPSPGGMGTFHALCIAALAIYGIDGGDGFSYANISFFAIQIFYNIVAGCLALILLPILNKKTAVSG